MGPVFQAAGYWIVAGAVVLERSIFIGLIIPGDVILALGGIYAARRGALASLGDRHGRPRGHRRASRWATGSAGGTASASYRGCRSSVASPLSSRAAEEYFRAHGGKTVFIGRFATAAGSFIPFVAGVAKMPFGRFLAVDVPAIILWAGGIATVGYVFGSNLDRVERLLSRFGLVALGLLAVFILVRFLLKKRRERQSPQ